jgi:hypothetical protein
MLVGNERIDIVMRIRNNYQERSEIVRLGNEIITFENVSIVIQGPPYEGLYKINKEPMKNNKKPPRYQFLKILFIGT